MWRTLFILVLIVGCIGFYRGWFHVTSTSAPASPNVTLTVDKDKIEKDKKAADAKAHDLAQRP